MVVDITIYYPSNSLTILLKQSLSKAHKIAGVFDIIVAALGALYSNDNSPKDSPG